MKPKFTIASLLWLTLVVALAVGWWVDRSSLVFQRDDLAVERDAAFRQKLAVMSDLDELRLERDEVRYFGDKEFYQLILRSDLKSDINKKGELILVPRFPLFNSDSPSLPPSP